MIGMEEWLYERCKKDEGKIRIHFVKSDRLILTQLKLIIENTKEW